MVKKKILYFIIIVSLVIGLAESAMADRRPLRILKVKLVADDSFAQQPDWKGKINDHLKAVEDDLRRLMGIRLEVTEYAIWSHGRQKNMYKLASDLVGNVEKGGADAIIGFTLDRRYRVKNEVETGGLTIPFKGMLIRVYVGDNIHNRFVPFVIVHEMVHLMGGLHVDDGRLMSPTFRDTIKPELDEINRRIIRLTHLIDFDEKYGSLNLAQLKRLCSLYESAIKHGNREIATYLELGDIYKVTGNYDKAITQFWKAAKLSPEMLYAWLQIGECHDKKGEGLKKIKVYEQAVKKVRQKDILYGELAALHFNAGNYHKSDFNARMARQYGANIDPNLWKMIKEKLDSN